MEQTENLIKPGIGTLHYWHDIWCYRELFFFLAWRDILVRDVCYFRRMERSFADVV